MSATDRESVEALVAKFRAAAAKGSPGTRNPAHYVACLSCQDALDAAATLRALLAERDAREAVASVDAKMIEKTARDACEWKDRATAAEATAARLGAEVERLRGALSSIHNGINIAGSPYDQAMQAIDGLVRDVRKRARAALAG